MRQEPKPNLDALEVVYIVWHCLLHALLHFCAYFCTVDLRINPDTIARSISSNMSSMDGIRACPR